MKECRRCGASKPLSDFYVHKQMADGHLNICKDCTKKRIANHRRENIDRIREYDRNRPNAVERAERSKVNYRERISTPEGREKEWAKKREYNARNPLKRAASTIVGNAIRDGKLTPQPCEGCGEMKTHAHHEDYYRPLDVMWLCQSCHGQRHREINAERR